MKTSFENKQAGGIDSYLASTMGNRNNLPSGFTEDGLLVREYENKTGGPPNISGKIMEGMRSAFTPRTRESKIERNLLSQTRARKKQEEEKRLAAPLGAYHLSILPEGFHLDNFIKESTEAGQKLFISYIFSALEKNTKRFMDKWSFVKDACEVNSTDISRENPVVHGRFNDIALVRNTAIPDINSPNTFIHANMMNLGSDRRFIAMQRPRSCEIPGFWHAVNAHAVPVIIDLTTKSDALIESDWKSYCPKRPFGKIKLTDFLISEKLFARENSQSGFFKKPEIEQKNLVIQSTTTSHSVARIKFPQWPDHGVVEPGTLIRVADLAETLANGKQGPILIHCRAGVGRTGTLMSFMAAREMLSKKHNATGKVPGRTMILRTVLEVVAKGRVDRGPSFVQNAEQFTSIIDELKLHFENRKLPAQSPDLDRMQSGSDTVFADRAGNALQNPMRARQGNRHVSATLPVIPEEDESDSASSQSGDLPPDDGVRHREPPTTNTSDAAAQTIEKNSRIQVPFTFGQEIRHQAVALWCALNDAYHDRNRDFLNPGEVDDNGTDIPCPRDTAVSADMPGDNKKLHANYVRFQRSSGAQSLKPETNITIAGQAPREFAACERLLFKSIESRQGIFQIVSERSQRVLTDQAPGNDEGGSLPSVIEQLRKGMAKTPALIIGGRYEVMSLTCRHDEQSSSTYLLEVKDTLAKDQRITIPLTQAGLKFEDRVLKVPEIVAAREELTRHLALGLACNPQAAVEPIVLSTAGVGRNATLIVFRQIASLIESKDVTTEVELRDALLREITVGRIARGAHFIHSEKQLEQLLAALLALLPIDILPP